MSKRKTGIKMKIKGYKTYNTGRGKACGKKYERDALWVKTLRPSYYTKSDSANTSEGR
jgi:hypothetical protein